METTRQREARQNALEVLKQNRLRYYNRQVWRHTDHVLDQFVAREPAQKALAIAVVLVLVFCVVGAMYDLL